MPTVFPLFCKFWKGTCCALCAWLACWLDGFAILTHCWLSVVNIQLVRVDHVISLTFGCVKRPAAQFTSVLFAVRIGRVFPTRQMVVQVFLSQALELTTSMVAPKHLVALGLHVVMYEEVMCQIGIGLRPVIQAFFFQLLFEKSNKKPQVFSLFLCTGF